MADRKDTYFKQLVLNSELDAAFDDFEFEHGFNLWALMPGARFQGSAAADNLEPEHNRASSIVYGMRVVQDNPTAKTVGIDYGVALVQTEDDGGTYTEQQLNVRETDLASGAKVPMLASLGDPRQKVTAGLFASEQDFTATIAAITAGQFVKVRLYATLNRDESDPRTDGNGVNLNFVRRVGQLDLEFDVGTEAASAGASVAPALRTTRDNVHLAIIQLADTTTTILNADIDHKDRRYTGITAFSGDARTMTIKAAEDAETGVTTGTKAEVVFTITGLPTYTDVNPITTMDQTVESRRSIWGYNAADGGATQVGKATVGLFHDKLILRMEIYAVEEATDQIIAGVGIMKLGATGASDIVGLKTDGTCDVRYRYHNNSGVTVSIVAHAWLEIYDNRGGNFPG